MGRAVRATGIPVLLAAGTTAVSLLANLTSKFEPVVDFGIVASIGLVSGWIVMTNFVPAARLALDRRRQAKGQEPATSPVADTIPGAGAILRRISAAVVHRPLPILGGVIVVTILATIAATNLETTFTRKSFLPQDSETVQTLDFPVVQAAVFMIAIFVFIAITLTDIVFLFIDPRLRRQRA